MIKDIFKKIFSPENELYIASLFFLAAVLVRLYCTTIFFGQSADEMYNVYAVNDTFKSGFRLYPHMFMWFYYFAGAALMFCMRNAYVAAHAVSVFFSSLSVWLVYYLARETPDSSVNSPRVKPGISRRAVAALAALLLLINPEFTLIGSTTLREPTSTCFMLLACLFLMRRHILWSAVAGAFAFLTRFESIFILMPWAMVAVTFWEKTWGKRLLGMLVVSVVFASAVWFLHLFRIDLFSIVSSVYGIQKDWGAENLGKNVSRLTLIKNLLLQAPRGPGIFKVGEIIIKGLGNACIRMLQYVYMLIGPNVLFFLLGLGVYVKRALHSEQAKIFLMLFIFQSLFFLGYLFEFGALIFGTFRYLYWILPFAAVFISYGFFYCWQWSKGRGFLVLLLACNIVIGAAQYARGVGGHYFSVSNRNRELIKVGDWIRGNVPRTSNKKILGDGVAYFYLSQTNRNDNSLGYGDGYSYRDWVKPKEFMSFLTEQQVRFVLWDGYSQWCQEGTPYLKTGTAVVTDLGELVPVKCWKIKGTDAFLYEFTANKDVQ